MKKIQVRIQNAVPSGDQKALMENPLALGMVVLALASEVLFLNNIPILPLSFHFALLSLFMINLFLGHCV